MSRPTSHPIPFSRRFYLLFSATGLVPIAFVYGLSPTRILSSALDIPVETTDLAHVMRAVMCLYLGIATLWILGALRPALTTAALVTEVVFMIGLATGRVISLVVDGRPSGLLVFYLALEVVMAIWGLVLIRGMHASTIAERATRP